MHSLTSVAALLAGAGLLSSPLYAQTHVLEPVVVTATRVEQRVSDTLSDVSVIDREQIEAAGQSTLTELLARQPGVRTVSNGGAGANSEFFIRGAESKQNVVLIDGVRVGSATSGAASLQYLPLSQIERIEIVRGPASAVYGADAVGGVIQIFTRRGSDEGVALDVFAGAGTHDTNEASAFLRGGDERWKLSLGASVQRTDGINASNRFRAASARNPDLDGYINRSYSGSVSFTPVRGTELGTQFLHSSGRNRFDSRLTTDDRNEFENYSGSAYIRQSWTEEFSTTLRVARAVDSYDSITNVVSSFRTVEDSVTLDARLKLGVGTLFAAAEHRSQDVDAGVIDRRRDIDSLQMGWSARYGAHSVQLNGRHDSFSGNRNKSTGNVTYGYHLTDEWRVHAGYGTAFRLPSFNELYSPTSNFGNPDVGPESSRNKEAGVVWQRRSSRVSLTAYDNQVDGLIQQPATNRPVQNVAHATLRGATVEASTYVGHTELSASYDLLHAMDDDTGFRLRRRAVQSGTLTVQQHMRRGRIGIEVMFSGDTYSSARERDRLGGYSLINLFGAWKVTPELALEGRLNNLTDKDYSTAYGYATLGATLFIGVRYTPQF